MINGFHSIRSQIASHPRISFFIAVALSLQLIILLSPSPPVSLRARQHRHQCDTGTVYVYQLPPQFNSDLPGSCDFDPHVWQCHEAVNDGLGQTATELAKIVPENLAPAWHRTHQFSSEIIFHKRILKHKCRTLEPEFATAFYIPFYAGLAIGKFLYGNYTTKERDYPCEKLIDWLRKQPYFERFNGTDHFIVLGRITWDFRRLPGKLWGSKFLFMEGMENVTHLTIERSPWDYHDVGIPYPTAFHPRSFTDIQAWQDFVRTYNRTSLFTFVGAAREDLEDDIRGLLLSTCRNESLSGKCRLVDCAVTPCVNGSVEIMSSFLGSDFCLQPTGDSATRRSVFDCMVAGSVPVFFWNSTAYDQYEWFLPGDSESYSVFVDHKDVSEGKKSIKGVLERYSREEVRRMREKVIETIPKILYGHGDGGGGWKDAFEIAVEGVLWRFKKERDQRRAEQLNIAGNI